VFAGSSGVEDTVEREGREEYVGWNRECMVFWLTLDLISPPSGHEINLYL
jgi:hypothetical protein